MGFWNALSALAPIAPAQAEAQAIRQQRNAENQESALRDEQIKQARLKTQAGSQPVIFGKPEWNEASKQYTVLAVDPQKGIIRLPIPGGESPETEEYRNIFTEAQARTKAYEKILGRNLTDEEKFAVTGIKQAYGKTLPGSKPYKGADGRYYQPVMNPDGTIENQPMPPDYTPPATKGWKFDINTGQAVNLDTGQRFAGNDPNLPPEAKAMLSGASTMLAKKQAFQAQLMNLRTQGYGYSRLMQPFTVYDNDTGTYTIANYLDFQKNPGRYAPSSPASKSIAQENLMQDIAGTSKLTRNAIIAMKQDFPADMKIKIAAAMRSDNPHDSLDQLIASGALGSLTNDQQDFLIATRQLAENAMAMRTILGAGQGSEDMRNAIRQTLPTLLSPDKGYALRQLNAFDATIARLHRGVARINLPGSTNTNTPTNATPKTGSFDWNSAPEVQ